MSRKLRFVPQGGSLVEVTCRTIQGRLLMRPSPLLNEIILGVLGRAQRRYPLEIVGYVFCWKHLSPESYRSRIAEFVRNIEETAAADRRESLIEPLGADGVRAQNPETRPRKLKKSPAPFVHAATKAAHKAVWEAYAWFVAAFREAADKLRAGDRNAAFPIGSFPPRLPFVEA